MAENQASEIPVAIALSLSATSLPPVEVSPPGVATGTPDLDAANDEANQNEDGR
jgi:hypothetical protein